jgi:transcriptional regulator with XRE-family HTH domain
MLLMSRPGSVSILLGRRVRTLRKLRGLTQEELGERAQLTGKFLGQIERGDANPSLELLARLARALQIELWELLVIEPAAARTGTPSGRALMASEKVAEYLSGRSDDDLDRALRILDAALGDTKPVR